MGSVDIIGGKRIDGPLLNAFLDANKRGGISVKDVTAKVAKHISDGGKLTDAERNTILFAMRHTTIGIAADRALSAIVAKLDSRSAAVSGHLSRQHGFEAIANVLESKGRIADLYVAKIAMTDDELTRVWHKGMTLAFFNAKLEEGLKPVPRSRIDAKWPAEEVKQVIAVMTPAELARFGTANMSLAEFQNIQYRGWEKESNAIKGETPYNPHLRTTYKPVI